MQVHQETFPRQKHRLENLTQEKENRGPIRKDSHLDRQAVGKPIHSCPGDRGKEKRENDKTFAQGGQFSSTSLFVFLSFLTAVWNTSPDVHLTNQGQRS